MVGHIDPGGEVRAKLPKNESEQSRWQGLDARTIWQPGRDSNPDTQLQRLQSYR